MNITLNAAFTKRRTLPITLVHGTTSAADVRLSASSVTFDPDQMQAEVRLTMSEDFEDESNEIFTIELGDGAGYELDVGQSQHHHP